MDTRNGTSQGRGRSSTRSTHIASPGDSLLRAECTRKRGNKIKPCAVTSLCFWKPAREDLEPHPARAGNIFTAWRRRTLILWNRLCCSTLGLRLCSASATGKSARQSFCAVSRVIPPYTAAAARCTPLVPGDREMDRPFPPYALHVTIRDSSLGSAPGHDNMLNEFPHHLGPIAHGTLRTMIHNSFANGSLHGSWKMGDAIPIPKPGKGPCRPVSYRPITLLSVLLKLAEGMIHRRLSALLPHHPRQFGFAHSLSASDVVTIVIGEITVD
ncbi:hypothetical protein TcG_12234 [Trypanosoma cruzi]|nr:hypothetical protein TcG_12234 [Trypanosoma cruzi]